MCHTERNSCQRDRQVGRCRVHGLPLWYGRGNGCLGSSGGSRLEKENPALRLHCILPCEGQADEWSASARERYFSILEQADEVVYVSREYHDGCMLKRNRYLVDHAACLLAVYNGEWRGGTAMTVRYAQKLGREITILNPVAPERLEL